MSEQQLRDVLARVVPDPPDSVADPTPVVRTARVRRRAQVALAAGAVALVAVAGVVGGRALVDDDSAPQVADEPSIASDPFTAAACPDVLPESGPLPDLSDVTAVRFCAAGFNGLPAEPGPPDALVTGIDRFSAAVAGLPGADPARCAAIHVIPTDSRLLLQLADGTAMTVPSGMCQDIDADGRTLDANDVTQAFLGELRRQRDAFAYTSDVTPVDCLDPASIGPAEPGRESLVAAALCPTEPGAPGEPLGTDALALVAEGWRQATRPDNPPSDDLDPCLDGEPMPYVLARTDRGDLVRLSAGPCDHLRFSSGELGVTYEIPLTLDELTGS